MAEKKKFIKGARMYLSPLPKSGKKVARLYEDAEIRHLC